jgi:hypothetical protein
LRTCTCALLTLLCLFLAATVQAAPLILNEYNAVGSQDFLNGGDLSADADGGYAQDSYFGRVQGNGGDWFELAVVADGLDIRGWRLVVCETPDPPDPPGTRVCNQPLIFANQPIWTNLQAGTIITVAEQLPDDVSFDPNSGDWWIHVQAANAAAGTYITADNFPVSNDDWQLTIQDELGQVVFGPAGEGIAPGVAVNPREVFKLESAPSAVVREDSEFYDDARSSSFGSPNTTRGGLAVQDFWALRLELPLPDRDGDGLPDDGDHSGWIDDTPCSDSVLTDCDDNCPLVANPLQLDVGSVALLGPDGTGDACQCGDVTDDGFARSADSGAMRSRLAGLDPLPFAAQKCGVVADGACTILDVAVTERALVGLGPGIAPVCEAATGPPDPTELMFDPNQILEVVITIDPNDWDELRNQTRTLADHFLGDCMAGPPTDIFTFFPADVSVDGIVLQDVGVRKKGFFGSLDSTKPSLKVDFSEFSSGQRIRGLERMTLNNNRQDPSHVKQCLGYKLFRDAGSPASRCNFAHVVVNGQDLGIFSHVESVKPPFLERHFADTTGDLYEGTRSDFRPIWIDTFEKKTNPENPDRSDLQVIADALTVPDASLVSALDPLIDLDAFYTHWALEGIIGHWDGYQDNQNNYWIYFEPTPGKLEFIPWGIDGTFAGGNPFMQQMGTPPKAVTPRSLLTRRLYLNPPTQSAFIARLTEILDTVWDAAALNAQIDRAEALLTPYETAFLAHTPAVRSWIDARKDEILLTELGGGPPAWTEPLPQAMCLESIGSYSATVDTHWGTLAVGPGDAWESFLNGVFPSLSLPPSYPAVTWTLNAAGLDEFTPPGSGTVNVLGSHSPFPGVASFTMQSLSLDLSDFTPGIKPIGTEVKALYSFFYTNGVLTGHPVNGSITFTTVGTNPGDSIQGTISGEVATWVPVGP